jgi:ribosome recycling factor
MMLEDSVKSAEERMRKAVDHLRQELQAIRTGRAAPSLLDHIRVDYYGTPTPVNAVANITAPDPRMVVIQPWDKSMLGVIEKAILKSDLGINPTNDGQVLRLVLPQLTEERRRDLVKQVHHRAEESRVAVRNIRRDVMDQIKKLDREHQVQSEEAHRTQEKLEKLTAQQIQQIDEASKKKEAEVMEV